MHLSTYALGFRFTTAYILASLITSGEILSQDSARQLET